MYENKNGLPEITSSGNAVLGAYLNQLGLPVPAIEYVTQAKPADMQWLTFEDARRIGLQVTSLEPTVPYEPNVSTAQRQSDDAYQDWFGRR